MTMMTANEIIKALECCCISEQQICHESLCPLFGDGDCFRTLCQNVLDLIKRQRAEIEEYRNAVECVLKETQEAETLLANDIAKAKSEAVKGFAKKLKKRAYPFPCAIGVEYAVTTSAINDLIEEMGVDKE